MDDLIAAPRAGTRTALGSQACVLHGHALPHADALLADIARIAAAAPFRHLVTPGGHAMQVAMTNCGRFGWYSDRRGYLPDACLLNRYAPGTRLSLHQDRDEDDRVAPIVSVSLGLPATFLFGGFARTDRAVRVALAHGDAAQEPECARARRRPQ